MTIAFETKRGHFDVVWDVGFDVQPGQVAGVVGESGSFKSVTAMAVMGLLPDSARMRVHFLRFAGHDLAAATEAQMRAVRGREIGMVFQDPMSSLNPILTVGRQLREPLLLHLRLSRRAAQARAEALLDLVHIPSAAQIMQAYPHELSGGMRQRVMIAIALSCEPKLLVADEPTTALDVTTQAQIIELLRDLRRRTRLAVLLITHDLGVIAEFADTVQVMYAGRIVERAPVAALFDRPGLPYTEGLLRSMPPLEVEIGPDLPAIPGNVASPFAMPPGCAFHPRCHYAWEACTQQLPPEVAIGPGQGAACLRHLALAA